MGKDKVNAKINIIVEKIKNGMEQIKVSDAELWDRERVVQLESLISAYMASKNIASARDIRNYLMYNAHPEAAPWGREISSTQVTIDGKVTSLRNINGELDRLFMEYENIENATD